MKYVKIVSKSVTTPEDMFTLGVSTSRGKDDKIGQFGSGTLLGTLAWMRAYETSPVFMVNGKKVTFESRDVMKGDGEPFKQVLMCYGRKKSPLNVALEYGVLDWPTACLGLREWISNAIDAGAVPSEMMVLTNKIEASEDEVAVFVPYTNLAKEYFDNIGDYFLHFSGKQGETIIEKAELSACRIYRKGVYIRSLTCDSLFNYNLDFSINECRTGSSDSIVSDIEYLLRFNMTDNQKDKCRLIVDAILRKDDIVETSKQNWSGLSRLMESIFGELVGQVGLCPEDFIVANCTPVASEWFKAIVASAPQLNGLAGICRAEIEGFEISKPSDQMLATYHKCCELIETVGLSGGLSRPSLVAYSVKPDETGRTRKPRFSGLYDKNREEIMVWKDGRTHETMIHELAHHYSGGADDWSAEFAKFGHDVIAAIMQKLM